MGTQVHSMESHTHPISFCLLFATLPDSALLARQRFLRENTAVSSFFPGCEENPSRAPHKTCAAGWLSSFSPVCYSSVCGSVSLVTENIEVPPCLRHLNWAKSTGMSTRLAEYNQGNSKLFSVSYTHGHFLPPVF